MPVIIDMRNIAKISSYSILSGTIACSWPTEPQEIAHRMAKRLYCIALDYPGQQLIFANDRAPYWRAAFINNWYAERQQEPIPYKGNRTGMPWPFASSSEMLNEIYAMVQTQMALALGAIIAEDVGLEADDIWGIMAATATEPITGISSDSDWRQMCREENPSIFVSDPSTGIVHTKPVDISPKLVAGDRGDNIMGCRKFKKDGTPGLMWGIDGAAKLIAKGGDWAEKLDKEVLERNYSLIKLPCPDWDLAEAKESLVKCMKSAVALDVDSANAILDKFGLNEANRKMLGQKAAREQYIQSMRAHFAKENLPAVAQGSAPEPEDISAPKLQEAGMPNGATVYLGLNDWPTETPPEIRKKCRDMQHVLLKEYVSSGVIRYGCVECNYMFDEHKVAGKGA